MKRCLESGSAPLEWVKSSYSGVNGNCVEVAALIGGGRGVRDSKDPHGRGLVFSGEAWASFVNGVATGEFGPA